MTRNSDTLVLITTILIIGLVIFLENFNLDGSFRRPHPPRGKNPKEHYSLPDYYYYNQQMMECIEECEDMFRTKELNEEDMKMCIALCKNSYERPSHH
ncbi:uncharacterized protein DS421_13g439560 [Arachis hypogaea]|nr:uncharacterized protein DS421_13g439560 [Arachis hypogaea]